MKGENKIYQDMAWVTTKIVTYAFIYSCLFSPTRTFQMCGFKDKQLSHLVIPDDAGNFK